MILPHFLLIIEVVYCNISLSLSKRMIFDFVVGFSNHSNNQFIDNEVSAILNDIIRIYHSVYTRFKVMDWIAKILAKIVASGQVA